LRAIKAAIAVFVAPLVGTISYVLQIYGLSVDAMRADLHDVLSIIVIGWVVGLVFTIVIGLPVGFALSFVLRRLDLESLGFYAIAGAVLAFVVSLILPGIFGSQFRISILTTGTLLGVCFWQIVRRPALRLAEES
jgi:hypothetical protein